MNTYITSRLILLSAAIFSLAACVNNSAPKQSEKASRPLAANNKLVLSSTLKVATWNVEHLSYPIDTGCKPRSQIDLNAMRDYIERVNADIYALQEVASKQALSNLFPDEH